MVNWIALPVLILKPNLMGQTDKWNSGILRSSQSETLNLWEHPALKSFRDAQSNFFKRSSVRIVEKKSKYFSLHFRFGSPSSVFLSLVVHLNYTSKEQCKASFIRKRRKNLFSVSWRIEDENLNLDIKNIDFSYFIVGKCKSTKIQKIKSVILMNANLKWKV